MVCNNWIWRSLKTQNSGTTWKSIFDNQKSLLYWVKLLDPQNPNIIWVGTGENVGGRHVELMEMEFIKVKMVENHGKMQVEKI